MNLIYYERLQQLLPVVLGFILFFQAWYWGCLYAAFDYFDTLGLQDWEKKHTVKMILNQYGVKECTISLTDIIAPILFAIYFKYWLIPVYIVPMVLSYFRYKSLSRMYERLYTRDWIHSVKSIHRSIVKFNR